MGVQEIPVFRVVFRAVFPMNLSVRHFPRPYRPDSSYDCRSHDDFGKWKSSKQSLLKIIFIWLFDLFSNSNKNISMNYLYIELCSNRTSLLSDNSVIFSSEYSEFRRTWIWTISKVNDPELNDPGILRSWNWMVFKLDGFSVRGPFIGTVNLIFVYVGFVVFVC